MAMELYINGVQQTNFIFSTPYKDTIDEELDQLNIQIKSETSLTFNKFDKVRFVIKQIKTLPSTYETILDKTFCLFNYKYSLKGMVKVYQLTCLSPTKILENVIINGMADTYASTNFFYQITRIKDKINAQLSIEGVGLAIKFDTNKINQNNTTLQIDPKDFLWEGQVNAREIFNDIFSVINSLVIGYDFTISNGNITEIYITYKNRNATVDTVQRGGIDLETGNNTINDSSVGGKVVRGIDTTRDSEYAVGNVISLMKNGIPKDSIQQTFMPARNTDLTIEEKSSRHIITNEPIYSINRVVALLPVGAEIVYCHYSGSQWVYNTSNNRNFMIPIDITNYVVEKSVFDAMSLSEQRKHLYFIRGQKGIFGLYDRYKKNALQSDITLQYLWRDASIPTYPTRNGVMDVSGFGYRVPLVYTDGTYITQDDVINNNALCYSYDYEIREGAIYSFSIDAKNDTESGLENCVFSVNYQPYLDCVVKIEKGNINGIEANSKNLSIIRNQSDRTIDAIKYYDSQKSFANRMGNQELNIDAMLDLEHSLWTSSTYKTLWNLGDYLLINNTYAYYVVQRTFELYGENCIKINYKLSKSYNASNLDIGLKRDKRLYGIPLDNYVDRYIIIPMQNANSIDKIAIQCYDDFTGGSTTSGYCIKDVEKVGNSSITDKVVRCLDNYAVDIERTKYSSTLVNVNLRYGDTDGYASSINVRGITNEFYSDLKIDDFMRLPFIKNSTAVYDIQNSATVILNQNHLIYKDKMERLIFVIKQA